MDKNGMETNHVPRAVESTENMKCPKCGKAMTLKKIFWLFNCQCFTYTLPIRPDGTVVMPDGQVQLSQSRR